MDKNYLIDLLMRRCFLILQTKNYQNRPMFHGVIQKIKMAQIFETQCRPYFNDVSKSRL